MTHLWEPELSEDCGCDEQPLKPNSDSRPDNRAGKIAARIIAHVLLLAYVVDATLKAKDMAEVINDPNAIFDELIIKIALAFVLVFFMDIIDIRRK